MERHVQFELEQKCFQENSLYVHAWSCARLRHGVKYYVLADKLHAAYPQSRKVKLFRSEPLSVGGCHVRLPSSVTDFTPWLINVIFISSK